MPENSAGKHRLSLNEQVHARARYRADKAKKDSILQDRLMMPAAIICPCLVYTAATCPGAGI